MSAQTITSNNKGEVLIRIGDRSDASTRASMNGQTDVNANFVSSLDRNQLQKNASYRDSSAHQYLPIALPGETTATHTIYTKTSSSIMHRGSPETSAVSYTTRHLTRSMCIPPDDNEVITDNEAHILVNTKANGNILSTNGDDGNNINYLNTINTQIHVADDHQPVVSSVSLPIQTASSVDHIPNKTAESASGSSLFVGNKVKDMCYSCQKAVYRTDRVGPLRGVMYHNLCFRCGACGSQLTLNTFCHNNREMTDRRVFCKSHQLSAESSKGDMSHQNIQSGINKPKLTTVNVNIRGGPDAGKVKGYGADAVGIRGAMNVPKLETYNQTVRVSEDAQKGEKIDFTALNVKSAMNVPRLDRYNQTVRPVPAMAGQTGQATDTTIDTGSQADRGRSRTPSPNEPHRNADNIQFHSNGGNPSLTIDQSYHVITSSPSRHAVRL